MGKLAQKFVLTHHKCKLMKRFTSNLYCTGALSQISSYKQMTLTNFIFYGSFPNFRTILPYIFSPHLAAKVQPM